MVDTYYCINEDYLESAVREELFGKTCIDNGTSPKNIIIYEDEPVHFVQILFILKEASWDNDEWITFTKQSMQKQITDEYDNNKDAFLP